MAVLVIFKVGLGTMRELRELFGNWRKFSARGWNWNMHGSAEK